MGFLGTLGNVATAFGPLLPALVDAAKHVGDIDDESSVIPFIPVGGIYVRPVAVDGELKLHASLTPGATHAIMQFDNHGENDFVKLSGDGAVDITDQIKRGAGARSEFGIVTKKQVSDVDLETDGDLPSFEVTEHTHSWYFANLIIPSKEYRNFANGDAKIKVSWAAVNHSIKLAFKKWLNVQSVELKFLDVDGTEVLVTTRVARGSGELDDEWQYMTFRDVGLERFSTVINRVYIRWTTED